MVVEARARAYTVQVDVRGSLRLVQADQRHRSVPPKALGAAALFFCPHPSFAIVSATSRPARMTRIPSVC